MVKRCTGSLVAILALHEYVHKNVAETALIQEDMPDTYCCKWYDTWYNFTCYDRYNWWAKNVVQAQKSCVVCPHQHHQLNFLSGSFVMVRPWKAGNYLSNHHGLAK